MKSLFPMLGCLLLAVICHAQSTAPFCESWQHAYSGADVTGPHVIALWQFVPGAETKDGSGHGHDLKLAGAGFSTGGVFGGCLESFCGHPVEDKPHAVITASHASLSPKGAFTIELWLKPKPEFVGYSEAILIDKKYVAHTDYQLALTTTDKSGVCHLAMKLGFGDASESWISDPAEFPPGEWHHIAFSYNGAGTGRFWRDGASLGGTTKPLRGPIAPGKQPLYIGDRLGSLYHGFPGFIAQVRLSDGALEFRPVSFALVSDRTSFVRMEKTPLLKLCVSNLQRTAMRGAKLSISLDGFDKKNVALPELPSGGKTNVAYALNTAMRPDEYKLRIQLQILGDSGKGYVSEETIPLVIVPRQPPRMPVVMWGVGGSENLIKEIPRLKQIGFTHCLGAGADMGKIWQAGKPTEAAKPDEVFAAKQMFNAALANDLGIVISISPGHALLEKKEYSRIGRNGKPIAKPDVCGLLPPLKDFCYNVGASVALTYGAFPAWQAALIHTEMRDAAQLCFHDADRETFRKATGLEVPAEATNKAGVDYTKLKEFPSDCVIADDDPLLRYYRWFWKEGDGWNGLTSSVHRGLKSTGRSDVWTFHDPAVRVASTFGSGGDVDVISQWTYSYPDPIRIGLSTDELFAMARGANHQQRVMKMTQIIWYRSQTAPSQKGDEKTKALKSLWEDNDADAAFPTIAPLHLRETFWTKIARPISGIMYHGWQSLVPCEGLSSYRYTNPQAQHELRRLIKEIVEPLGPTLLQVPDRKSDVAFLESFASQMFAHRGTYGWNNGWAGDAYHVLQYAHLQPEVVYDETIEQRGLDDFRVLVMMDCDVLTASVTAKVKAFQKRGGIVVADKRLCPAINTDIVVPIYERTLKAAEDKSALVERAIKLDAALSARKYRSYVDSSSPDAIPRCRSCGTTDYLFVVNDHREFGDYVGQYGLVMENGQPLTVSLTLDRKTGFIYDLVNGQQLPSQMPRRISFTRELGPCEGGLFMVTERPIAAVIVEAGDREVGESVVCKIAVVDEAKRPIDGIIPVWVDIRDPSGRDAEGTGFYGAKGGRLELMLEFAPNDQPGVWQIRVRELASQKQAEVYVRLTKP